jgi:predicted acetyltransferase
VTEELRQATTEEIQYIDRIWDECWPGAFDSPDTKDMVHFVRREPSDVSMLFVDGEPASCVVYDRRHVQIGRSRLRLGALGYLATTSRCQCRGYGSRLVFDALRRMHSRGDHVSALFTFSYDYYRRFGYEVCGDYWGLLLRPADFGCERFTLLEGESDRGARPIRPDDFPEIAALHRLAVASRGWGLIRPAAYWDWLRGWLGPDECFVVEGANGLEGYVVCQVTPQIQLPDEFTFRRDDDPLWPVKVGPVLHVVEMAASTRAARRALASFLARQIREVEALVFPLSCRSDLLASGMLVPAARVRVMPAFMFRVMEVARAVGALDDLPAPAEPFTIAIEGDPAGINREPVELRPTESGAAAWAGRSNGKHHLKMSIGAFSQMLGGYRTASDLHTLGQVASSSQRAVALADQVFILRDPFIGELDLF